MNGDLGWLSPRQRDGGIDRIPLPAGVTGGLWLCGKHAIARSMGVLSDATSDTTSDTTPMWDTIVCLTERHELAERYPDYVRWLDRAGDGALWWPIPDMHAPSPETMLPFVDDLVARLRRGDDLLVHCGAGIGRAGTTAVCVLIQLGLDVSVAEQVVADSRPMAGPEVAAQRDLVRALSALAEAERDSA
jgi:hypothetical protein